MRSMLTESFVKICSPTVSVLSPARRLSDDTEVKCRRNDVSAKGAIFILSSKMQDKICFDVRTVRLISDNFLIVALFVL
jgi:hypothetical protein